MKILSADGNMLDVFYVSGALCFLYIIKRVPYSFFLPNGTAINKLGLCFYAIAVTRAQKSLS
jgi:hypothetical protein